MKPWTDLEALCEAMWKTETREEALAVVRAAPPLTVPFWAQDEERAEVDLGVMVVPVAAANDPEVA